MGEVDLHLCPACREWANAPGDLCPGCTDIFPLVHADLDARNRKGRETYGGTLRPFDGRDTLQDLYEELLDAAMYVRKSMWERDGR